jgi:hypothetical protein
MKKAFLLNFILFSGLINCGAQQDSWKISSSGKGYLMTEWLITYWNGTAWENARKYSYTYDGNNNLSATIDQDWVDPSWVNQSNHLYSYNGENKVTEVIFRGWDGSQWFNDDKEMYSYDNHGNILRESKYTWLPSSSDWLQILQKDYVYDASQNMTEWKIKKYSGGSLIDRYKMVLFYDLNKNMIESIYTISNDGITWENNGRYLWQYDQNNNLIESLSQEWNGSYWEDEFKMTYQYDVNNLQTRETIQYNDSTSWVNINQYLYSYDGSGNKIEHIKQNGEGSEWLNYERYTYEFTGSDDLLVKTYFLWDGTSWGYFNIEQNTYDEHENMIRTLYRDWESGAWADKRLDHFTYVFSNAISEFADFDFTVFPNPALDKFKVQSVKCMMVACDIDLLDLFGRKVMDVFEGKLSSEWIEINVSHLPSGVYFVHFLTGDSLITRKIIVSE